MRSNRHRLHNRGNRRKRPPGDDHQQYIAALLTEYYKMKDENGGINMTGSRTMAFQIPGGTLPAHQDPPGQRNGSDRRKAHPAGLRPGPDRAGAGGSRSQPGPTGGPLRAPRKPRRTTEPPVPPRRQRGQHGGGERHSGHRTITQGVKARGRRTHRKQMRPPAPFLFFLRRGVNMIQTSEKNSFYRG